MAKLDFNIDFTDLKGEPVRPRDEKGVEYGPAVKVGEILANALAADSQSPDPVKHICWAIELTKGNPIDLDESDQKKLRTYIEEKKGVFTALQKYHILKVIDKPQQKKK